MFYGRKEELMVLEEEYKKDYSFVSIYGTRRIGKTSLISKFIDDKNHIMFQAKEISDKDNLKSFSEKISEYARRNDEYTYSSWEKAFDAIISLFDNKKGIIVIDEYPYLVKSNPGITSIFQDIYDNKIKKNKIMLVLSGSNISFMENELNSKQSPLYKRITLRLKINKLPFDEAKLFLKKYNNEDKTKFLCMFGEYPYYLSMIDDSLTFDENIIKMLFSSTSILLDVPKLVLSNAAREQSFYNSILLALSGKRRGLSEIAQLMDSDVTKVNKYMITLLESEMIVKREMFNSSRQTYYYILDPVLRFYYQYIYKNIEKIEAGYGSMLFDRLKDDIHSFISHSFEDVAISYMEMLSKNNKLGGLFYPIQNLKIEKSELGRSIEIDGISKDNDKLLVIECKFTNEKRTILDYKKMVENVSIKMFDSIKQKYFYIISKSGFDNTLLNTHYKDLHLIDLNEMYE